VKFEGDLVEYEAENAGDAEHPAYACACGTKSVWKDY